MSAQTQTSDSELPHPRDDPPIKYAHEGKQYQIFATGQTFHIDTCLADAMPTQDGVVIIESDDGEHILSEHRHSRGGVSRKAIADYIPDEAERAAWTVRGLITQLRNMEIGEVDPGSYDELYWDTQED